MMQNGGIPELYARERDELVSILRRRGIGSEAVLRAIGEIPRHLFVKDVFLARAYEDSALPIDCRQTISQPYTVAFMTEILDIRRGDKTLEVGTGSGYQACILAHMGARVFTIERHSELLEQARRRFETLRWNIASKAGDGSVGWSEFAPFEKIIVTAGAPEIPPSLLNQLADGGTLVAPVGSEAVQTMIAVDRKGDRFTQRHFDGFKFVPLVGKEGWKKSGNR
jgi:protein-L-isoaspartate(D-aspartate) O-methyltransferase